MAGFATSNPDPPVPDPGSPTPELQTLLPAALRGLLSELLEGPSHECFILNPGDNGLSGSLARLSAADASARPNGRSSVAAHAHHLRYGFELLNRWLAGDQRAYDTANFGASWKHQQVDDAEWRTLRDGLEREIRTSMDGLPDVKVWTHVTLSGGIGIMAHLAYHLGAIRQLTAAAAGLPASD